MFRCVGLMNMKRVIQRCMIMMIFWGAPLRGADGRRAEKHAFFEELPLRGADERGVEMYDFLGSLRCAGLVEEGQRCVIFWRASASRG